MKKTLVSIVLVVALIFTIMPNMAMAANTPDYGDEGTTYVCDQPVSSELKALTNMVDTANATIDMLVKIAIMTPYDDVDSLLKTIDKIVSPVFRYADRIGVTVVCEYEEVVIDGRTVLIDPLRVVNI
ncbi:MAG: hypothetical protein VB111_06925 [Clostridiaceae bacterium]|nr:hypothetical protein [Clostridiaceae bacterium]